MTNSAKPHMNPLPPGFAETQAPWNDAPALSSLAKRMHTPKARPVLDIDSPDFEEKFTAAFTRNVERALGRQS